MNIIESLNRGLETKYHLNEAKEDKEKFLKFAGQDLYDRFETLKSKQIIKGQDADYTYWEKQSLDTLKDFIEKTEAKQNEKNKERTAVKQHYRQISDLIEGEDYNFIYSGNGWTIYEILTHKASMWLGKDTKWCITMKDNPSYFNQYINHGANYYFLIPDKNPESGKWCYLYYKELKLSDNYFWDSTDVSHTIENINVPLDVLSYLPGVQQKLIDYIKEKQEIRKEIQRTGVYIYNPLDNFLDDEGFIQDLNPKKIIVSDSVKKIGNAAFYGCTSLEEITLPNSIKKIGNRAFANCYSLQKIVIPNGVEEIGMYAFCNCKSLQEIVLSDTVEKILEGAFYECVSLQEINILNSVKEIGKHTFNGCKSLQEIIIPDSIEKIGCGTFASCTSLQEISIPNSVKEIGDMAFANCTFLQEITIPNSVEKIEGCAFCDCKSLQEIRIPDGIKNLEYGVFKDCTSLQEINLPDSVTKIGRDAFNGCRSLQEIRIPDKVKEIGVDAFNGCRSLQEINIPDSVENLGVCVFKNCRSLKEIYIKGEYRQQIFSGTDLNSPAIIYWVDCGIKETL